MKPDKKKILALKLINGISHCLADAPEDQSWTVTCNGCPYHEEETGIPCNQMKLDTLTFIAEAMQEAWDEQ